MNLKDFFSNLLSFRTNPEPERKGITEITVDLVSAEREVLENKARALVLDFIEIYEQDFNVFFITTDWQTRRPGEEACLVLGIHTSSPGRVIGLQGANAQKISSYIGSFLKVPIYTKGVYFDPFKDALPK